jgi:tetratricopeptide (TPR) repeat protein
VLALVAKVGALCLVLLVGLTSCSAFTTVPAGQASFDRGLALFNRGHFREAIPHFERATAENPTLAPAYLYLGRSHLSMRRWRDAIQPLRTAHRLSPEGTKHEAFTLLMDALFAAALGGAADDRPPEQLKHLL